VLIPEDNIHDLKDLPESVTKGLEIIPVSRVDQVIENALISKPEPIEWSPDKADGAGDITTGSEDPDGSSTLAH